ncbi:EmrB/QacA subfamily drug resistance transporter [Virgibacillus natechei]|uniref:EmrB/QacA subfamily drug resistance transporter n=2 Tax=Virgibacillus natechei TaxID=1216297 RepID=A0ABS4IKJ4_9BACI|nr:DHA2 family efflux MFS transporter permease subunit [Virgibacillus natechei]MBP1971378.1 EmrB/QacA subfamily drug resistance transporter [Virgibacillus natechei]
MLPFSIGFRVMLTDMQTMFFALQVIFLGGYVILLGGKENLMAYNESSNKTIIVIVLATTFLFTFSQFLLITAYPTLMQEFSINATQVQWLTTAFLLTTVVFIPMTGYLSDTYSARFLVIFSLVFFVIGTVIALLAPNFIVLIISRVIQAVGAGIMVPLVQTILLGVFPFEKRGFALGLLGLVVNVAPASAPSLSGIIIDIYNWRALFWIMLFLSLAILVLAHGFMRNVTEQRESKLDLFSIILAGIGFSSLIFGMSNISVLGFSHWSVITTIVLGIVMLAFFVRRQLTIDPPLLNLFVFRKKMFAISTILVFVVAMLLLSMETILPMFSQEVLGTSAFLSGFVLVPGTIILSVMSLVAGNLFDKYGGRRIIIFGFLLILLSSMLFSILGADGSPYLIMFYFCIFMMGIGLTMMPLVTLGFNSLQTSEISHASAIGNTVRQFGLAFGVILLTTIISITTNQMDQPYEVATFWGMKYAFIVMSVISLIGGLLSLMLKDEQE